MKLNLTLCASLLLASASRRRAADNWPQWRGPVGDGVSHETHLPTQWSATDNIAWKLTLPGSGGSTPAVWGDRVFVTCQDGADVVLMCVGADGKQVWRQWVGLGAGKTGPGGDEGNGASASPATDGAHVYAFTGTGDLACFDMEGHEVWTCNAQERYGKFKMQWGFHSTPLLDGDRLYLQLFHSGAHVLIALDKNTGKEIWKAEPQERRPCGKRTVIRFAGDVAQG